ncbi:cyclic nucleotide-binding domain-containing protein [Ferruginibacter sp.]|uniref:cyclic nucleotide-binding domain-containing protein n=1 Tax=Ferruginibacter sp. TaxID=1940288 RepID=UPI002658576B|nr:cyclic nucleotide-binding domain-containing protein [Ferruginibacter sp.]
MSTSPGSQSLLLIEKVLLLRSLSIFSDTPEIILAELAPLMQQKEVEQGTLIFEEGEQGDCMYIILSGEIEIHKGKTMLAVLKEKEVFGELSLLDAETRSASATAKTDCLLFKIDQEPFYELIESRPEVAMGFIKILCKRLRQLNDKTALGAS